MAEHEKRIREASNYALDNEWSYPVVENNDLRALLADLDAVRADAVRWRIARDLLSVEDIERAAKEKNAYGLGTEERESLKADAAIDALKGATA